MNSYCFGSAQPMIPEGLMHEMYEIKSGAVFSQEDGGQWVPGEDERIPFKGVLLPVSNKDLVRDIAGVFTQYSEKYIPMDIPSKSGRRWKILAECDIRSPRNWDTILCTRSNATWWNGKERQLKNEIQIY